MHGGGITEELTKKTLSSPYFSFKLLRNQHPNLHTVPCLSSTLDLPAVQTTSKPEVLHQEQNCTIFLPLCWPLSTALTTSQPPSSLASPISDVQEKAEETPSPLLQCVCVDITGRLFSCVCQSVMTELNTGIYPVITAVSGQALQRNWVCGTVRAYVCPCVCTC